MQFLGIIFQAFVIGVLVIYWIFAFVTVYHLTRFGIGTQPKRIAGIFLTGSLILSAALIIFFIKVDISNVLP
ncbi:MAG: hypothetical protein WBL19_02850 [Minisyncoccia bacterium]